MQGFNSTDILAPLTSSVSHGTSGELELVACYQDEIQSFSLPVEGDVTLGRAEDNRIRLVHPSVSRHHARLRLGEKLIIEDLGGSNGTFVRDASESQQMDETLSLRQLANESAQIAVGESVTLGAVTIVIRRVIQPRARLSPAGAEGSLGRPVVLSPAMRTVYEQARRAANALITVLILGETGVGKELLAHAIHTHSPRAKGPFMSINCAALSETLLEGELFGYERGAFTGASQARPGLFEAADGGTVFLDEIGELPTPTQPKLLRVLEERAVMRLGARSLQPIDVRFIAATNRDLSAEVAAGRFRNDLYFRLTGITLAIPPLRERLEDIEPLVHAFVEQACRQLERSSRMSVPGRVMDLLRRYAWPGNVRELRNVIERAMVLCEKTTLGPEDLPATLLAAVSSARVTPAASVATGAVAAAANPALGPESEPKPMHDEIRMLERLRIVEALNQCHGNQTQAAKLLGISRRTLTARLGEFGLPRPRKRSEDRG